LKPKQKLIKICFCSKFLQDVKARVKEVTSKDYIDPEENTVDYALLFIPNEQIYVFINEMDRTIIDFNDGTYQILAVGTSGAT